MEATIYIVLFVLLLLSALCSGLTLGMMSLNVGELERKVNLGDKDAEKVLAIRKSGSRLLCTLLLSNTAVNSTVSVVMGSVTSGLIAGLVSTVLIVIFGEIIPQAMFSRYPLKYGARMSWLVRALMFIVYPAAKPLSIFIDFLFGKELPTMYNKREIAELIKTHEEDTGPIDSDERRIMLGALHFSDKRARDVMAPRPVIFCLPHTEVVTPELLKKIKEEGYSRIPIYLDTRDHIVGVLYAKKLIGSEHLGKTTGELSDSSQISVFREDTKLDIILNNLLKTKKHISFVYDEYGSMQGIVTMEDVMEEIINTEILDESDDIADMQAHAIEKAKHKFTTIL